MQSELSALQNIKNSWNFFDFVDTSDDVTCREIADSVLNDADFNSAQCQGECDSYASFSTSTGIQCEVIYMSSN